MPPPTRARTVVWKPLVVCPQPDFQRRLHAVLTELASARNPYRARAFEEIAKHYEHREKNYAMALEMTRNALLFEDTPEIRRREDRLKARLARPRSRRLAL